MYVVIAAVQIHPGLKNEYLRGLESNARGASNEPGCLRFDVIQDGNDPDRIWFYEAYTSEAALKAHQQTAHFLEWLPIAQKWRDPVCSSAGPNSGTIFPPDGGWT